MGLKRLYANKPFMHVRYPNGINLMLLGQGHPEIAQDISEGKCHIVEEGRLSEDRLEEISRGNWFFSAPGILTQVMFPPYTGERPLRPWKTRSHIPLKRCLKKTV